MSVFKRLKSFFTGKKEDDKQEEKTESNSVKVPVTSKQEQASSNDIKFKENGVSGIESSEPIKNSEEVEPPKENIHSSVEEATVSDEDTLTEEVSDDVSNDTLETEQITDESSDVEEAVEEVSEDIVASDDEEISEDIKDSSEEIDEVKISVESEEKSEDENETDNERDNMTLLQDNDVYTNADIDEDFKQKFIDAGLETVNHCFQCGTCGGGCPSGRRTPYRVRRIVRKCLLGLRDEVISDPALWMCTTCYTCQERCPRKVEIVEVIKLARNEAAHAGYMADAHKATGKFVIQSGHGVPINDKIKALRVKIGLPEVPPTTHKYPEALKEIQDICKICEFDKLVGYEE